MNGDLRNHRRTGSCAAHALRTLLLATCLATGCSKLPPDEPRAAALVDVPLVAGADAGAPLLLLTEQSVIHYEKRSRSSGRFMVDGSVHYSVLRHEVWSVDPATLAVRWRTTVREARPDAVPRTPRLIGSDGTVAWWSIDQVGALELEDGAPRLAARPSASPTRDGMRTALWQSQVPSAIVGDTWIGLLDTDEAATWRASPRREAGWPAPRAAAAGAGYRLWRGRIRGAPGDDGMLTFDTVGALPSSATYDRAAFLRGSDGQAVSAHAPDGLYVLHERAGGIVLDRIATDDGRTLWSTPLPQARVEWVHDAGGTLLFVGTLDAGVEPGTAYRRVGATVMSAISIADGNERRLDIGEASLAIPAASLEVSR